MSADPCGCSGGSCGGGSWSDGCCGDGCCTGVRAVTPVEVTNRPGLPALVYRVGTHADFLTTMRARLSGSDRPGLRGLRTRDPGDLSIALLDGWATVADVLTFYTERIANEGYLRTATERFSVVQLAALLGYQPRPGLSASTYLAYTVAPGPDVVVPAGSRAQSVPGPGELPATFETSDALIARAGYNVLRLRRTQVPIVTAATVSATTGLSVAGAQNAGRPGDSILITFAATPQAFALFDVVASAANPTAGRTELDLQLRGQAGLPSPAPAPAPEVLPAAPRLAARDETGLAALTAALRRPPSVPPVNARALARTPSELFAGSSALLGQLVATVVPGVGRLLGDALANSVVPETDPVVVSALTVRAALFGHQAPLYPTYTDGTVDGYIDPMATPLPLTTPRTNGGIINLADPDPEAIVAPPPPRISPPHYNARKYLDMDAVYDGVRVGSRIALVNPALPTQAALRTVKEVRITTARYLGLTGRVTRLTLDQEWPDPPPPDPAPADGAPADGAPADGAPANAVPAAAAPPAAQFDLRTVLTGTTVHAAESTRTLAEESLDAVDVTGDVLELEGVHADLVPGRWVVVTGERVDVDLLAAQGNTGHAGAAGLPPPTGVPAAELSMIAAVEQRVASVPDPDDSDDPQNTIDLPGDSVHTFLRLAAPLAYRYLRPSVSVYGNVVEATHGETRGEVLGSGDATRRFPEFPLKQPPVTYLPAPTAAGAASTLTVYVDGAAWQEVDDLLDSGPLDHHYLVRTDDSGAPRVVFGDGTHGAVPPTGVENITARYRSGIGTGGNLDPGRITLLTTKPLGVTDVSNRVQASGGADPEGRDVVRENAPLTVQALDRLVSVADYGSFSRVFAGIGSSDARLLSDRVRQVVHVTVSGIADAPIDPSSELVRNLTAAMSVLGDPDLPVYVAIRRLKLLVIAARIRVAPDRLFDDVEPAIRAALLDRFGPDRARIGRPVAQGVVLAAIAAVPGVQYVDLDVLDALDEDDVVGANPAARLGIQSVVSAAVAALDPLGEPGPTAILAGELLRLDPGVPDTLILTELTGPS